MVELIEKTASLEARRREKEAWVIVLYGVFLALLFTSTSSSAVLGDNIALYYKMESVKEQTRSIYNLTANEGTVVYNISNCLIGLCGQYSENNNNLIPINNFTTFNSSYSINFWIRFANSTRETHPFSRNNNFGDVWTNSPAGQWSFQDRWTGTVHNAPTPALVTGTWYMITITRNESQNGNVSIYINGTLKTSGTKSTANTSGYQTILLGTQFTNNYDLYGQLDEVAIWNDTLSRTEIIQLYNSGAGLGYEDIKVFTSISPANNSFFVASPLNFTASFSVSGSLNNATLRIWNSTGLFNQTIKTISGSTNTTSINVSGFTVSNSYYVWNYEVCYTSGTLNCLTSENRSFIYGYSLNSETYNLTATKTANEGFGANITVGGGFDSASLVYDGTSYPATVSSDGTNVILQRTITIPSTLGTKSFYWSLVIDGITFTTTSRTQSVLDFTALTIGTSCSAGYSQLFYYDIRNENNNSLVNSTVKYNIQYGMVGNSTGSVLNGTLTGINDFTICYNSTNPIYIGYGEFQYYPLRNDTDLYSNRRFYLFQNVRASTIATNGTLFLLPSEDSTPFQMTLYNSYASILQGRFLALMRWYPEVNSYKIVEMGRTDQNGQTTFNLKTVTEDYRLAHYYTNGTLVELYPPMRFVCSSSPCSYNIYQSGTAGGYIDLRNLQQSLTYNSTSKIFSYIWNDPTQQTSSMNMTVYKDAYDTTIVACSTEGYGFTGVITCNVSAYTGTLRATIYRTASPQIPINELITSIGAKLSDTSNGRTIGLLFTFILSVFLFIVGLFSPIVAIILGIVAMIPAFYFGGLTHTVFIGVILLSMVIVHFLRRT